MQRLHVSGASTHSGSKVPKKTLSFMAHLVRFQSLLCIAFMERVESTTRGTTVMVHPPELAGFPNALGQYCISARSSLLACTESGWLVGRPDVCGPTVDYRP